MYIVTVSVQHLQEYLITEAMGDGKGTNINGQILHTSYMQMTPSRLGYCRQIHTFTVKIVQNW